MKTRIWLSAVISILVLGSSITVYAQPKTMADGNIFDAEFYAETYEDVKEALGEDEEILYQHYLEHGKKEGRLPYDEAEVSKSNTTKNKTKTAQKQDNATQGQKSGSTVVDKAIDTTTGEMVWIPRTGAKYHKKSTCSNMKKPSQVPIEEAKDDEYTACKKCYKH